MADLRFELVIRLPAMQEVFKLWGEAGEIVGDTTQTINRLSAGNRLLGEIYPGSAEQHNSKDVVNPCLTNNGRKVWEYYREKHGESE